MSKVKMKRQSTAVDMTAMCDVAFLLLTFFILTSKFRPKDPVDITTPGSQAEKKAKAVNVMTITLDKSGKVFFGMDNPMVKEEALKKIGEENGITFTAEEIEKFKALEAFGVPLNNMKEFLGKEVAMEGKDQPGVPVDTASSSIGKKSELMEWLRLTSDTDSELRELQEIKSVKGTDEGIGIIMKGDGLAAYPQVGKIVKILQSLEMNKLQMITALKGAGGSGEAKKE